LRVSDDYVLVTEGLTKEFAGFTAVRDVNSFVTRSSAIS
jgi:ABC-type branched-subunit amino acid transport system ATPase component